MNQHKPHNALRVSLLVLVMALLLPSVVKLAHAFENHEHVVCKGENQSHLHELDLDCEFYKFKLNTNFSFEFANYEIFISEQFQELNLEHYTFLNGHQQRTAYLRGPPCLVAYC
ncbi:hypothetical protein [Sediminibacter sp. Hel_I_10]|uniref:hypothetical protein n=1 Tax=Sediminibacter sp. Hel_I_10 TaxID=1392490 RepID=UPI00047ACBF2|nr:hypothetical protein [Sediminibacter sp. Hel_I_10]